ncbi:MAG TPA: hypothetical protein VMB50_15975, partial [Myxococcales bacterium]|nr:hypothetical protein [Myxococcales bacterium]
LAAVPWFLSGRYWLTQKRIIWKRLGAKPQSMALKDIASISVGVRTFRLTLKGPTSKLTLRFVKNFKRLWGALILFRELPLPERVGTPRATYRGQRSYRMQGNVMQEGYGVLHRESFFFLPKEDAHHLGADAAKLVGALALAAVGVHRVNSRADLPFDLWLSLWSYLSDDELDGLLRRAAEQRGGSAVSVGQLERLGTKAWYRHGSDEFRMRQPLW